MKFKSKTRKHANNLANSLLYHLLAMLQMVNNKLRQLAKLSINCKYD